MTAPADCLHQALRIEPGVYRCSLCGTEFDRKPAARHIAEMRAMLRGQPVPPTEEDPDGETR